MKDEDVSDVTSTADVSGGARSVRRKVAKPRRVVKAAVPANAAPKAKETMDGAGAAVDLRRRALADVCKVFGDHLASGGGGGPGDELGLPPRLQQTLRRLVRGDSEKQVATQLGLSKHTVHVYVKQLYKRLGVSSRGELLAKFVRGPGGR